MDTFFPDKHTGSLIGKTFAGHINLNKAWNTTQVL